MPGCYYDRNNVTTGARADVRYAGRFGGTTVG
jgi:hypothetical protein